MARTHTRDELTVGEELVLLRRSHSYHHKPEFRRATVTQVGKTALITIEGDGTPIRMRRSKYNGWYQARPVEASSFTFKPWEFTTLQEWTDTEAFEASRQKAVTSGVALDNEATLLAKHTKYLLAGHRPNAESISELLAIAERIREITNTLEPRND